MNTVWILAEQRRGELPSIVLEVASAARRFAEKVEAVTWGTEGSSVANELGAHGISRVLNVGDIGDSLAGPPVAAAMAAAMSTGPAPDAIFIGSTYNGRDIAARLSARLDLPVITNVVGLDLVDGQLVSSHAAFGGDVTVTARFTTSSPEIFVIRSKSFDAEATGGPPAEVAALDAPDVGPADAAKVVNRHVDVRSGPSLEDASVVVSGGRGLGSAENYHLIEDLAQLVKGAPGASRAIVDLGWVPYSYQVGQTGKIVKPDVYLAFGISGATQHLVGIKGAKHIIAVDKDPGAPIFQVADVGVVGDVAEVLPRLIDALRARTASAPQ